MSFLAPAFLFGAAAAAVPLVLHLMRRSAVTHVSFSAVRFLRQAPVEQERRKRLRELLLLLIRMGAVAALAIAFARPYFGVAAQGGGVVTVVALDTSLSMSGSGTDRQRFDRARALALAAVDGAPSGTPLAVIAFSDAAEVVLEPTADRSRARAAIENLQPGYGATRYRALFARAAALVGDREGRVIVVTDLQQSGWGGAGEDVAPARALLDVLDAGAPPSNLAVVALRPSASETAVVVANSGDRPVSTRVALRASGRHLAEQVAIVPAASAAEVTFPPLPAEEPSAEASIADREGIAGDDRRYALTAVRAGTPLLLITGPPSPRDGPLGFDEFYIERALAAGGGAFAVRRVAASALDAASDLGGTSAIILLSTRGVSTTAIDRLATLVEQGAGLLVPVGAEVGEADLRRLLGPGVLPALASGAAAASALSFGPVDVRHPIFRPFGGLSANFTHVRFSRVAELRPGPEARVLARFSDGAPAVIDAARGSGRVVVFASDLGNRWNDFPLQPVFVPFLHETMGYLAGARQGARHIAVGELPAGVPRVPGIVRLADGRVVAANVDADETSAARMTVQEFQAAAGDLRRVSDTRRTGADAGAQEERQSFWRFAILAVGMLLAAEGWLGRR